MKKKSLVINLMEKLALQSIEGAGSVFKLIIPRGGKQE